MWKTVKTAALTAILALLAVGIPWNPGCRGHLIGKVNPGLAVQAAETGSIQVNYQYGSSNELISDAEFSCVQIADAVLEGGSIVYEMREPYSRADYNPNAADFGTDPEMAERYQKLYRKHAEGTASVRTTGKGGTCRFTSCTPGLYLVWQSEAAGEAEDYEISKPLVVTVPSYENGSFVFSTAVYPKTSRKPVPEKTDKPRTILDILKPKTPERQPSAPTQTKTTDPARENSVSLGWQPIPEVQPEAEIAEEMPEEDASQYRKGGATGDDSHVLLWLIASGSSLTGIAVALIVMWRRHRVRTRYQSPSRR